MTCIPYSQGTDMSRYLGDCYRREEAEQQEREALKAKQPEARPVSKEVIEP